MGQLVWAEVGQFLLAAALSTKNTTRLRQNLTLKSQNRMFRMTDISKIMKRENGYRDSMHFKPK